MRERTAGFIGFGAVGKTFARLMLAHGATVRYYDVRGPDANADPAVTGADHLPLPGLVAGCDPLISAVVTHAALDAARDAASFLVPGQIYVDLNATSPQTKVAIGDCIAAAGGAFVDAALLGPVNAAAARAQILLAGPDAERVVGILQGLGLENARFLSPRYGDAATVKMLRSVYTKGAECLLIEMLAAAHRLGRADLIWQEMTAYMAENSFEKIAANWVKTHVAACGRREHEMAEVVATLAEAGIEPLLSRAVQAFFARSVALEPEKAFPRPPEGVAEVAAFFGERLSPQG